MKIKTISYKRLFNLGNYNNEEISFSAELEDETPEHAFQIINGKIEDAHIYSERVNQAKQMLEALSGNIQGSEYTNIPYSSNSIPALELEINKTKSQISIHHHNLEVNPHQTYLQGEITRLRALLISQEQELQNRKTKFFEKVNEIKRLKEEYGKTN